MGQAVSDRMTRRNLLTSTMALAVAGNVRSEAPVRTSMGVNVYSFPFRWSHAPAYEFAEYCASLGAGGVQAEPPSDLESARKLRQFLESRGMYFEGIVRLPKEDTSEFEQQVRVAKEAGAVSMRTACLGGRRYEIFTSLDEWQHFVQDSRAKIARAIPILEKYRVPLGVENHKDWTVDEFCGLMKEYGSEYLGVCLDTGNNLALLDNDMEVVQRLAPHAINTHLKDMGLAEYRDGILLVEPPLGDGFLDVHQIVTAIRQARPSIRFTLEMITRDPLKVPVFTDKYWVTFPDRNGRYLARTISTERSHAWQGPLPEVEHLPREARLQMEEENVKKCLVYAKQQLAI